MKDIELIPLIDACDFPTEVQDEFVVAEISTHYQCDIFWINWTDNSDMPLTQAWLIKTFGEGIKKYKQFALAAT